MPAIYHEGSWLGNATDPEVLVKDTVGWTGKNRAYSQTNNAVIAHIENGITYDVSWTGSATVTLKKNSASGATITSGSTSPLSFTADADYELYFGSSATVTNIMVKDSRITDPAYEPYHESVEEEIEQIYADNGVLGAKNLGRNNLQSQTSYGVTYTHNNDDSITLSGTETKGSDNNLPIDAPLTRFNGIGNVIFSFEISGFNKTAGEFAVGIYDGSNWVNFTSVTKNGIIEVPVNVGSSTFGSGSYVCIMSRKNFAGSMTIKYMVRFASDPDDTYQPHAMTNRELTDAVSVEPLNIGLSASDKATKLREDSGRCGHVVSVRIQIQVTAEISNNTEIFRLNGLPHTGYGIAILGETNTGEIIPLMIPSSDSNFVASCRKAIPTGYYAISYTYVN